MHLAFPSIPSATNLVSQTLTGFANRASTAAKNFESDLQSGNIAGAQSFLSALEQKLSAGNAGNGLAPQFAQVSDDLKTGDLAGAQSDFSQLELTLSQRKQGATGPTPASGTQLQNNVAPAQGMSGDPSLTALAPNYLLQQSAYNSALNLSVPASLPGFSANW
jgi:hypothetical protein